jgi:hypothetical protein
VARGWESKSVEEQIQASAGRSREPRRERLTPQQIEIERKRDGLLLQRTRVLRDLANCTHERYRQTLENGLAYLEQQLRELGWEPPEQATRSAAP